MTGSEFMITNNDPTDLAGLSNLELIFEGGSEDIDPIRRHVEGPQIGLGLRSRRPSGQQKCSK